MRKITQDIVRAFRNGECRNIGNSSTDGWHLYLHGNMIARKDDNGTLFVNFCGWNTPTTKERINGLCEIINGSRPFHNINFDLHRNGVLVEDDAWLKI